MNRSRRRRKQESLRCHRISPSPQPPVPSPQPPVPSPRPGATIPSPRAGRDRARCRFGLAKARAHRNSLPSSRPKIGGERSLAHTVAANPRCSNRSNRRSAAPADACSQSRCEMANAACPAISSTHSLIERSNAIHWSLSTATSNLIGSNGCGSRAVVAARALGYWSPRTLRHVFPRSSSSHRTDGSSSTSLPNCVCKCPRQSRRKMWPLAMPAMAATCVRSSSICTIATNGNDVRRELALPRQRIEAAKLAAARIRAVIPFGAIRTITRALWAMRSRNIAAEMSIIFNSRHTAPLLR